jgi:hypothetical protein
LTTNYLDCVVVSLEEPELPVVPVESVDPEPVESVGDWLFAGVVEPPVESLPVFCSCWVAGSGVPVVVEQATRLPDNNRAAALRKNHLFIT